MKTVRRTRKGARYYHLFHHFRINKQSLKRKMDNHYGHRNDDHIIKTRELLDPYGSWYTLDEIEDIVSYSVAAHDEAVTDYPEEYSPLELRTAKRNIEMHDWRLKRIEHYREKEYEANNNH